MMQAGKRASGYDLCSEDPYEQLGDARNLRPRNAGADRRWIVAIQLRLRVTLRRAVCCRAPGGDADCHPNEWNRGVYNNRGPITSANSYSARLDTTT